MAAKFPYYLLADSPEGRKKEAEITGTIPAADLPACAGDIRRGQSLVVWAIREGRQCAREVDAFLMGSSELPR